MNKLSRIAVTSAVALALAAPAYAQSTTPIPPASDTTPQAAPSGSGSTGAGSTTGGSQTKSGASASGGVAVSADGVIAQQASGQTLSSELVGMKVVGSNQESIGKVSNLIVANDQVVGAVLDVGGFLGLGAKKVGVAWEALSVREMDGSTVASVSLTKEELAEMPEFKTMAEVKAEQSRQQSRQPTAGGAVGGGIKQ